MKNFVHFLTDAMLKYIVPNKCRIYLGLRHSHIIYISVRIIPASVPTNCNVQIDVKNWLFFQNSTDEMAAPSCSTLCKTLYNLGNKRTVGMRLFVV